MSDGPDGLVYTEARSETAEQRLEKAVLGAGRRPGVLIEDASHKAVSFGGSILAGNAGAFLAARTYAYPGSELARSGKGGGGGSGFGDNLLGGAEGHAGDFTQPREGGLVRLEPLTEFAVQLLDALLYLLDLLQRLRDQEPTSGLSWPCCRALANSSGLACTRPTRTRPLTFADRFRLRPGPAEYGGRSRLASRKASWIV